MKCETGFQNLSFGANFVLGASNQKGYNSCSTFPGKLLQLRGIMKQLVLYRVWLR